jgi:hypothetical protein
MIESMLDSSRVAGDAISSRAPADSDAIGAALVAFFELIAARDYPTAAGLWDVPALILGDDHVHGPMSSAHLARLLAEAALAPTSVPSGSGAASSEAPSPESVHLEPVQWISERVALVNARWPEGRLGGFLQGVESTTFMLRIDEYGAPKIRGVLLRPRAAVLGAAHGPAR